MFVLRRGGSRIFSRGGADFQKIFENFDDLFFFFRSTKLIFRALPKHGFVPILAKFFAPQAKIFAPKAPLENLALFQFPPFSKYRVLCLFYVLLRLNA